MHDPVLSTMVAAARPRPGWRSLAACWHSDPELFFPISSRGPALSQLREAQAICARCKVAEDCLSFALESGQDYGVWGGTSEAERRAMRAQRARNTPPLATA